MAAGKAPLTPNGVRNATADVGQVDRWLKEFPEANWAETGRTYIDVDDAALAGELRKDVPLRAENFIVETPRRGGVHIYLEETSPASARSRILKTVAGETIGELRRDGQYVVAPGSTWAGKPYNIVADNPPLGVGDAGDWIRGVLVGFDVKLTEDKVGDRTEQEVRWEGWDAVNVDAVVAQALSKLDGYEASRLFGLLQDPSRYLRTYHSASEMDFAAVSMLLKADLARPEVVAAWRGSLLGHREKTELRDDYVGLTLAMVEAHLGRDASLPKLSSESEATMLGGSEETKLEIIPSTEVAPPDPADEKKALLNPIVPEPPGLVLLSGETSAGKTTLSRNFAVSLAEGEEFAGLAPPRAVRVLYVDLESPENVHRGLVAAIGRSPNLGFIRRLRRSLGTELGRQDLLEAIEEWRAEVVVIDPLPIAWPCRDENDNAEADRQMTGLKMLAVETSTTIIALWNMGEGRVKEKFRARGATARLDRADLGLNFTELLAETRQLKIVKSRYGTLGLSLTLKFAGDMGFEAVDVGDDPTGSRLAQKQVAISEFMTERSHGGQDVVARREIVEALGDEDLLDKAISRMLQGGEVERVERGQYRLRVSSEPPSVDPSEVRNSTDRAQLGIVEAEDGNTRGG